MADYSLFCLGNPRLVLGGRPVRLEMRKALALLVYLRLAGHDCSRESLAALFWPEYDQQHAQANLRRTLASLNKSLGIDILEADREKIGMRQPSRIWLDVEEFLEKKKSARSDSHQQDEACSECLSDLETAIQLYRGDFLEGFNLNDCPDFDEWQLLQRESLRHELGTTLQRLTEIYASQSRWEPAIAHALRWLGLDRLNEPAHRALIDLYARSGQRSTALRQYEELAHILRKQLAQEPEQETRQLLEQIRGTQDASQHNTKPNVNATGHFPSPPLLKTKLYIPSVPASRVVRSHLIAYLSEVEKKTLTLVSAPAGFGKTTLLAEWITQTSLPVAWLALDSSDNDPYSFLSYLLATLESIQEGVGTEAQQLLRSPELIPVHGILASMINDLGKVAGHFVLAMDDYQFINEQAVHDTMMYLLDHLPAMMHIVIVTRADPPLQLGRLRAHGQMLELRAQDLRFNPQETIEFLNAVMKLGLSQGDIEALESRTEGWVAGLKMAALSLKGHENVSAFIQAFSGSHRYILDYLMDEVLKRQPAHIQRFLLETSILEKLNGPLCIALVIDDGRNSGENGQEILEYLERNNLFVVSLDDERKWFRYHHLFADLLRTRFRQNFPELEKINHRKAAKWFDENSLPVEAVDHALTARDFSLAADIIEKYSLFMIAHSEIATILRWINSLPAQIIRTRPRLLIFQAWVLTRMGDLDPLARMLQEVESQLDTSPPSPDDGELRYYITQFRAYMANVNEDPDQAIHVALSDTEQTGPTFNKLANINYLIGFQLGYAYFSKGDLETAEKIFRSVAQSAEISEDIYNTVIAQVELAGIQLLYGNLSRAEKIYLQAMEWLIKKVENPANLDGILKVCLADIHFQRNELEKARGLVQEGIEHALLGFRTNTLAHGYTILAHMLRAKGELIQARDAVEQATIQVGKHSTYPRTVKNVNVCQVDQWLAEGDLAAAQHWALEVFPTIHQPLSFNNELEHIALARVLLASQRFEEGLDLLEKLAKAAEAGARSGRLITIYGLQALALQGSGSVGEALHVLRKSLELAQPEGYIRVFLTEGKPMLNLIEQLRQSGLAPQLKAYVNQLLETALFPV